MTIEKTNKEMALGLIDNLVVIAAKDDKEMTRLKRLAENPRYNAAGESAMVFHLKTLRELVEQL